MINDIISTYYSDCGEGFATVIEGDGYYLIEYYTNEGVILHEEKFEGKSLHYVEDAAENWALGIKKL